MPNTTGSQNPSKKPGGNGQGTKTTTGPSKKTRDEYLRKLREIIRKKEQEKKKSGG